MAACREALEEYLCLACQAADHSQALVSLSLALGVVEIALTSKTASQAPLEPEQLQARSACLSADAVPGQTICYRCCKMPCELKCKMRMGVRRQKWPLASSCFMASSQSSTQSWIIQPTRGRAPCLIAVAQWPSCRLGVAVVSQVSRANVIVTGKGDGGSQRGVVPAVWSLFEGYHAWPGTWSCLSEHCCACGCEE